MDLEIHKKTWRGVFYPLVYKRGYNKKNRAVLLETMSGPPLSKCQMLVRVASWRDPVETALFDFSSLSLAPSAQPFSLSLSLTMALCSSDMQIG